MPEHPKPKRQARVASSHSLLAESFDRESVVRIYQERAQNLLCELRDLANALGMGVELKTSPSRQRVEFDGGSCLILRPLPRKIPSETYDALDRLSAANRNHDQRVEARNFLLSLIDSEPRGRAWWRGFSILARREQGRVSDEDAESIEKLPAGLTAAFVDALAREADKPEWIAVTAGYVDKPNLERIRQLFVHRYPEFSAGLTDGRLALALQVFPRRGGGRPNKKVPTKWNALADLMNAIGLGPIKARSLRAQWHESDYYRRQKPPLPNM